jgi:hypothetical protein
MDNPRPPLHTGATKIRTGRAMGVIYVARSAKLSKWASDVGLSRNIFKVGYTEEPVKAVVEAGWAGEDDWTLVKQEGAEGLSEENVVERLARREKMLDPKYYPRIRETLGLFKVDPVHVENHIVVTQALADTDVKREALKLKPRDFADYLIHNARR